VKKTERRTTPVTDFRREILSYLKQRGEVTVQEAADRFEITHEGARRQFLQLEQEGWIVRRARRDEQRGAGRPTLGFTLTPAGDHLFPKHYDVLSLELIEAVVRTSGPEGLRALLAAISDKQATKWEPKLRDKSLEERLDLLKGLYFDGDPYMAVRKSANGEIRLIENNCPFLNVATQQPALCSLTVGTLQNLLGVRVVREEKFQNGDRRCVFRVLRDQPVPRDEPFAFEDESAHRRPLAVAPQL
jgi:predicted ArsR family transcriptional regulator